jgi:hypothetical protein
MQHHNYLALHACIFSCVPAHSPVVQPKHSLLLPAALPQPMGPLTLADFIGLDTCLSIMRVLRDNLGDDKYRPCPLLTQYVDAGAGNSLGRSCQHNSLFVGRHAMSCSCSLL